MIDAQHPKEKHDRAGAALILGAIVVAIVNFAWQLGSSSYFVDEVLSVEHSTPGVGRAVHLVLTTESTPPTYFLFLHEWLGRVGSQSEWVARLPSVVAGVLLVAAVCWLTSRIATRTAVGVAGLLVALSPLVLEYAQQVRVYALAMLAVTVAVAAAVEAERRSPHATRWLTVSGLAAILAIWLHYTSLLVVVPLAVWIGLASGHDRRRRLWWLAGVGAGFLALVPILVQQSGNPNGLKGIAILDAAGTITLLGTPFSGRTFPPAITVWSVGAALVVVGCAAWAAISWSRERSQSARLVTACAIVPVACTLAAAVAGQDIVINRYTAVAAPFLIVLIARAVTSLPRPAGATVMAVALAACGAGLVAAHQRSGFYLDARGIMSHISHRLRPNDVIFTPASPGVTIPLTYYGKRDIPAGPPFVPASDPATMNRVIRERHRVWTILDHPHGTLAGSRPALRVIGYRPLELRRFPSITTLGLLLIVPG